MLSLLRDKLVEVVKAVAPLVAVVCLLMLLLFGQPGSLILQFLTGSALIVAGMILLFAGLDLGVLPMGRLIGGELPKQGSVAMIVVVAFALGFATTIAEPDVLVLAKKVDQVSRGELRQHVILYAMALGVAVFAAVAMARIVYGFSVLLLLAAAYASMIALSLVAPVEFAALAHDAGSVTTGVLTAPVVIAVAVGLSSVLGGRSAVSDGFGLLGFSSVGAIIAVLLVGLLR
jgi:Protein of unknown function (DUF1538)